MSTVLNNLHLRLTQAFEGVESLDKMERMIDNQYAKFVTVVVNDEFSMYYWKGMQKVELNIKNEFLSPYQVEILQETAKEIASIMNGL